MSKASTGLIAILAISCSWVACDGRPKSLEVADERKAAPGTDDPWPDLADSSTWIRQYDPSSAFNGYTLALFMRRVPILMDMNGRIVHAWSEPRVKSRIRLSSQCSLLAIGLDRSVVEFDWNGKEIWRHEFPDRIPHHEVTWLANGNVLTVLRQKGKRTDDLVEIDREGNTVWEWSAQRLQPYFGAAATKGDITHINSVQELPPNRWYEGGDERFRPGNLLISARNLNLIFVLERDSGEVVWTYDHELDLQHEALMISSGAPHAGNILLFNNGYRNAYTYRQSSVIEIDPTTLKTTWRWADKGFYSPTGGIEQPLPNGNVLISSSRGGRAFEVNRRGRIVWQWIPPFDPNRPQRYPFDHCPQSAVLERGPHIEIRPPDGFHYIDPDSYRFARRGAKTKVNIDGSTIDTLNDRNSCVSMTLPDSAEVHLGYGINRRPITRRGIESYTIEFGLSLTPDDSEGAITLLRDRVDLASESWKTTIVDLGGYAYQTVDLCVTTERIDTGTDSSIDLAYWANPIVVSRSNLRQTDEDLDLDAVGLTPEELAAQKEHLKALGYLD